MSTKTISGIYSAGYALGAAYASVDITRTGSIGGTGLVTSALTQVVNYGHLNASGGANGLTLGLGGGGLSNMSSGYIQGGAAAAASGAGSAGNAGGAGAYMSIYGVVGANSGVIAGGDGGAGVEGTVVVAGGRGGAGGAGVMFTGGGALQEVGGSISGGAGGIGGTAFPADTAHYSAGAGGAGGSAVSGIGQVNISLTSANVVGGTGGEGGFGSNYGGEGGAGGVGLELLAGGSIGLYQGLLQGGTGGLGGSTKNDHTGGEGGQGGVAVVLGAAGTLVNTGSIIGGTGGAGGGGVERYGGGGGYGGIGVYLTGGGEVVNRGAILGGAGGPGTAGSILPLSMGGGGGAAIVFGDGGLLVNYGTVIGGTYGASGQLGADGLGVVMSGAGAIVNGSSADSSAFIGSGSLGGDATDALYAAYGSRVTVTNFGTIAAGAGAAGVAVRFESSLDTLVVKAGCAFAGAVDGGGGVLVLGSGAGTLDGAAGLAHAVVVSGSMATTTFANFGAVEIAAGASFILAPGMDVAATRPKGALVDAGTAMIASTLSVEGILDVSGKLAGAAGSELLLDGGMAKFTNGASLTVATVAVSGSAQVSVASKLAFSGIWTQAGGALTVDAVKTLTFNGSGSSFSGLLTGKGAGLGIVAFAPTTAALATLNGVTISGIELKIAHTTITVGGSGATLGVGAVMDFDGAGSSLTGPGTVINAGIIESTVVAGATVASPMVNNGVVEAAGGKLTFSAAVTGSGSAEIAGGALDFASNFSGAVDFLSGAGRLILAKSQGYTGAVTGFSTSGATTLDLQDIGFVEVDEASFSGDSTSGVLTITDGAHTAKIALNGDYLASSFTASSDGHGGVLVIDSATPGRGPPAVQAFASAMAGLARAPGAATHTIGSGAAPAPVLVRPRAGAA